MPLVWENGVFILGITSYIKLLKVSCYMGDGFIFKNKSVETPKCVFPDKDLLLG